MIQNNSPDEDISLPPPVPTTRRSSSESYKRDKFHSPNEDQDDNSSRNSTVSSIELINAIVTDVIEKNYEDLPCSVDSSSAKRKVVEGLKVPHKNPRIEAIYSSGPNCTAFCSSKCTASRATSTTGSTYYELNAVNLDLGTHLPNEKQQATFRCLPQETRNKVTCNIEEKRIEVLRDGRKDDQPQLSLSPSDNVLNKVMNKNLIV